MTTHISINDIVMGVQIDSGEEGGIEGTEEGIEAEGYEQLVPRSEKARLEEERLKWVKGWLEDPRKIEGMSERDYAAFVKYATRFFIVRGKIWKRDRRGEHKLVVEEKARICVMNQIHHKLGHKRFFATRTAIQLRFWWPHIQADIAWFVRTCDICQRFQVRKLLLPPVVANPAPLCAKIYIDSMHMPLSGGFKYYVHGRCSMSSWPEARPLRNETGRTLGDWVFEDWLCRWGPVSEIVSDNGAAFVKALEYLAKKYHIHHIRISGYNSRANGIVERHHFDIRQALIKAADGDEAKWSRSHHSVLWAERMTPKC